LVGHEHESVSKFAIIYSDNLKEYDLGHVLTHTRYQNFIDLFQEKLGDHPDFEVVEPPYATPEDLRLIHTEEYIQRIERCQGQDPHDTPLSPGLVRAVKLLAGAGKQAGELVQSGSFGKAFVIGGGVQHANREREKGFGVFSDVGICAENLLRNFGLERILVIDTDAHAGDGLYEIFCTDSRVLFLSIHQDPHTLYPGKGFIHEIGDGEGRGYSVNIPLSPGSADQTYEYVLTEIFTPLAQEFRPEMILMVDGADPHFTDRITQMGMTLAGISMVGRLVGQVAGEICQGKMIGFVGSGYSSNPQIVSLGWLASIVGVTRVELGVEEPEPIPAGLQPDQGFNEAKDVVRLIRAQLSPYWKCFTKGN
jgi:acetoin utilization protein AcuC